MRFILPGILLLCFSHSFAQEKNNRRNLVTFAPAYLSTCGIKNEPGAGFAISYERDLGKDGIASFSLPVNLALYSTDSLAASGIKEFTTWYVMPGLKFYPTGKMRRVSYAVGPNITLLYGKSPRYVSPFSVVLEEHFAFGTMLFNSLNTNLMPRLLLGFDMGFGLSYIDQRNGVDAGPQFLFQMGAKMGYRF